MNKLLNLIKIKFGIYKTIRMNMVERHMLTTLQHVDVRYIRVWGKDRPVLLISNSFAIETVVGGGITFKQFRDLL